MFRMYKNIVNKRRYFIVTSHGNTGTLWLAANLNNHPEILCTHNYYYPIVEPLQKMAIQKAGVKMRDNINKNFWQLSVNEFFKQHEDATTKRILGNVHAFTYGRLHGMMRRVSSWRKRRLAILNMVREPISRINSSFYTWKPKQTKFDFAVIKPQHFVNIDFLKNCDHILNFLEQKNYKIDKSCFVTRCFVVALLQSEHIATDVALTHKVGVENIKFEEMTKNPDYYPQIFSTLTSLPPPSNDNLITLDDESLIHKHNPNKPLTTQEQFEQWEDWQKDAFRFVVERNSMKEIYKPFDYDLNFI